MKKNYATPTLKVVEFKAEAGFATSGQFSLSNDIFTLQIDSEEDLRNEQYQDGGNLFFDF